MSLLLFFCGPAACFISLRSSLLSSYSNILLSPLLLNRSNIASAPKLNMDLGRGSPQAPVSSGDLDKKIYGQIQGENFGHVFAEPMSGRVKSDPPDDNVSATTLTARFKEFTTGRKSLPPLRGATSRGAGSTTTPDPTSSSTHGKHVDPETAFKERFILQLDPSQPLKERSLSLKAASKEVEHYSVDTLMAIWAVAEDFAEATASTDVRLVGYDLLLVSVCHSGLDLDERLKFFDMISIPLPTAHANLQILALEKLTQNGQQLSPFESQLPFFLDNMLEHVFEAAVQARHRHKRQRSLRSRDPIGEEVSLMNLLTLVESIVKHNPDTYRDNDLAILIDKMHSIFIATTAADDINRALAIFERLITFPSFPLNRVAPCVNVLCALISAPNFVSECPTRCLHVMLTGRLRQVTLDTLLGLLYTQEEGKPDVRIGALSTLDHVLVMNGANNFPVIPLQSLSLAFKSVWRSSRAATLDCLRIVGRLLHDDQVNYRLLGEDWTIIETTLDEFAKLANETDSADETVLEFRSLVTSSSPLDRYFSYPWSRLFTDDPEIQNRLRCLPSAFEGLWDGLNEEQKWSVINICFILEPVVDDDLWEPVVQFIADVGLLCPPNENWARHLEVLVYLVVLKPSRTESARCKVLQEIKDVRASVHDDQESVSFFDHIVLQILDFLAAEPKTQMLSVLAEFTTDYALHANMEIFDNILETFSQSIGVKIIPEFSVWTTLPSEAISILTTCLVQLCRQCLHLSALKFSKIYDILVSIAASSTIPHNARFTAVNLLSRLRCNPHRAVKIVPVPDSQGLAATLCRTEASAHTQPTSHQTNRVSFNEESQIVRTGRSSAIGSSRSDRSRSATRSASGRERLPRPNPPFWMYGSPKGLNDELPAETSSVVYVSTDKSVSGRTLDISGWMDTINKILLKGDDWEIYSYLLVHLPSQLSNTVMFDGDAPHIQTLHTLIISQLQTGKVHSPPTTTGMKQGDVALCLLHTLTILVSYRERFTKKQLDETVRTFLTSMEKWDGARKCCIHALALCSHELPSHIDKFLDGVVQKMSQIITQSHLAIDILEFLGGLVRLPDAYRSAQPMLFRTIFGICKEYLKNSRGERQKQKRMSGYRTSYAPTRHSNTVDIANSAEPSNMSIMIDGQNDLPEYVFALAYHVITFWFLAIDIQERSSHVGWISKNLGYQDDQGNEIMEEQSQVTLDMMHRTAYSDLGETMPSPNFQDQGNKILKKTWLVGMSIVTVEIFRDSGLTQITKRQASGTTHAIFHQQTAPLPSHHIQPRGSVSSYSSVGGTDILPNHILLQLSSTITPMPIPMQPIILPDDDSTRRALNVFDHNDTVDGHKAGVIYISEAQSSEPEILANTTGSALYEEFLTGLGTKVSLANANFNTQGLDRAANSDGTHTYAWRDRVTEIVFHVTTMMPTDLEHDPQCVNKKRHIGNDFVNIIFNDSGLPFDLETFKSQFNYVNIIITPDLLAVPRRLGKSKENQTDIRPCFKVQTVCFPSFPQISPAATPKVVSASSLPGFVRQLALNASVFSHVWSNREGGEHVSSWRNRLRAIAKLRERYANTGVSANVWYPDMGTAEDRGGARSYLEGDAWKGTLMMGGLAEEKQMHLSLDFTRWT